MPLKSLKGTTAKKGEVAEKVKEIQMRQKNWLRQRDEHMKNESDGDSTVTSLAPTVSHPPTVDRRIPREADIMKVNHDSSSHLSAQLSDDLNVKVKRGFGSWLMARGDNGESADHGSRQTSLARGDNGESADHGSRRTSLVRGHIADSADHSRTSNGVQHGHSLGPDSLSRTNTNFSNSTVSRNNVDRSCPLTPAEFDTLADRIASRVKNDLGIGKNRDVAGEESDRTSSVGVKNGQSCGQSLAESMVGGSSLSLGSEDSGSSTVDISSHRCAFCSIFMMVDEHVPMLLVPCAHTVCRRCASSHGMCRLCGTKVTSMTPNLMLQQIIRQFSQRQPPQERGKREAKVSPFSFPCTTAQRCEVNYSIQLKSLLEEHQELKREADSRRAQKSKLTTRLDRTQSQLQAITRQEEGLEQQLRQLQDRLQGLQQHREEYGREFEQLKEEQAQACQRLDEAERTLKSLRKEIDKVQFLAEGQNDMDLDTVSR